MLLLRLHYDFFSIIMLSSILFSITMAAAIFFKSSNGAGRNLPLILFILSVNVSIFNIGFIIYTGNYRILPHLLSLSSLATFLNGPLFYFFTVNAVSSRKVKMKFVHFLAFVVFLIIDIPYLIKPGYEKIALIDSLFISDSSLIDSLLSGSLSSFGLVHMSIYICMSWFVLRRYRTSALNQFSHVPDKLHKWLQTTVLFLLMVMTIMLVAIAVSIVSKSHYNILFRTTMITVPLFLCFLLVKILFQPEYFLFAPEEIPEASEERKSKIDLDVDVARKAAQVVNKKQLYKKHDLTLSEVASEIGVSRTVLSEVINTHFEVNFYDFINRFRINYVKRQIEMNPENVDLNSLVSKSGFKSRTTFNVCFKRYENLTPTQFRKMIRRS